MQIKLAYYPQTIAKKLPPLRICQILVAKWQVLNSKAYHFASDKKIMRANFQRQKVLLN